MPEYSYLSRAREIGVESFWYKEEQRESLLDVMERTMAGESVYPDATPELQLGLASSYEFTERELEVLREMTAAIPIRRSPSGCTYPSLRLSRIS